MATAKQIAARKRFAEMAKSGKLATMRKKAAKKPRTPSNAEKAQVRAAAKKNPAPKKKVQTKRGGCNPVYSVQIKKSGRWVTVAKHTSQSDAEAAAKVIHSAGTTAPIRVWG